MSEAINSRGLVVTGFQVVTMAAGKEMAVGRVYHVRAAAESLAAMLCGKGEDARVREVMKFEGDPRAVK